MFTKLWRNEKDAGKYGDVPGFCKSVSEMEVKKNAYALTPGRYVGAEEVEDDDEPFDDTIKRLTEKLEEQFAEGERLSAAVRENVRSIQWR